MQIQLQTMHMTAKDANRDANDANDCQRGGLFCWVQRRKRFFLFCLYCCVVLYCVLFCSLSLSLFSLLSLFFSRLSSIFCLFCLFYLFSSLFSLLSYLSSLSFLLSSLFFFSLLSATKWNASVHTLHMPKPVM